MEQAAVSDCPGLWLGGGNRSEIEAALDDDPSVDAYSQIDTAPDERLYRIEFADEVCEIGAVLFAEDGTILAASAASGTWSVRMRFPDHEHATRTYRRLLDRDIDVDVRRLQKGPEANSKRHGLTSEQYETIVTAIERGYFEIPRQVSTQELADEFGISNQSVSERLRRASGTILSTELNVEDGRSSLENRD